MPKVPDEAKTPTGLEFLRETAQTLSPLHLATVAIVAGGSMALDAEWAVSAWSLHGIAAAAVVVAIVALSMGVVLTVLGLRSVQEWIREGWPRH